MRLKGKFYKCVVRPTIVYDSTRKYRAEDECSRNKKCLAG